jgi:4-aminobutyrate aminotransferase / (S)-3-amino-2-methylpropionate transaminase / 5-aminovalerate transaminase
MDEPSGQQTPLIVTPPPGPQSRTWQLRHANSAAPMGPPPPPGPSRSIVYSTARGSNVVDVDGNRYVDLAGGFGAQLLGHLHPHISRVLSIQSERLWQALGDVYPGDAKVALCERLAALFPELQAKVILGQSGADAVTAALKTAVLYTGKPGVLCFGASYHGLSYAPLATTGLRASYSEPFAEQLNPHVRFAPYPTTAVELEIVLARTRSELQRGDLGALLVEPILGRGGVLVPPAEFIRELGALAREQGALLIADEIWTGLGRAGRWLFSSAGGFVPDLVCLGKGLGGGLPMSATIGRHEVMSAWRREREVVHTSTFAGAPLLCSTAIATLDILSREQLPERSSELGGRWFAALSDIVAPRLGVKLRGSGMMVGVELEGRAGGASALQLDLLRRGYITTTGGGQRETLVLTPPLNIDEELLFGFVPALAECLAESAS